MLLVLPLSGCFQEQKQQVATCEFDARRTYPNLRLETSNDVGEFIKLCMKAAGYDWDLSDNKCQPGFRTEANPYCYVPSTEGGKWAYHAEQWLIARGL